MRLVSGDMIWTNVNKIPFKYPYLSDNINCDVAIIGAGVTGAICAYYLVNVGVNTVIVDENIAGYASTSASTSILQYEIDYDLMGLKGSIGLENAIKCFKLCNKAVYDIEKIVETLDDKCDFRLKECLYYTSKKSNVSFLKKEYELRKQNGFDIEFIDKHHNSRFSFPIEAGIYSRKGAAEIDPYRFTHALISHSVKKGLKVFENTQIVNIDNKPEGVVLTTNNKFKINAKKVVIAIGFKAPKLIKEKIVSLARTFTIATKPINNFNGWYNKCIIRDMGNPYTYLRTTGDNRIIIGGEDEDIGGINSKMYNLTNKDPLSIEKYNILLEKLKLLFPSIKNIEPEYKFSGFFGDSKDGLPYIGQHKDYPNCYFCLGYGSNGIVYAVIGGQFIRDMYLGNYRPEFELFKFER